MAEYEDTSQPVDQTFSNLGVDSDTDAAEDTSTKPLAVNITDETAKTLKRRLDIGVKYVDKNFAKTFKKALKLYVGEHFPTATGKDVRIVVNYILHVSETIIHSVAFRYPEFNIVPLTPVPEGMEDIARSALKYQWKESEIQLEAKRTLKDKVIFGTGIALEYWDTGHGEYDDSGKAPITQDNFCVRRIHPGCFIIDPECGRVLKYAEYCGYWEWVPLTKVKSDKRYKNVKTLKGTTDNLKGFFPNELKELDTDKLPSDIKRVKLLHYYGYLPDSRERVHVIFCNEHDKPLFSEKLQGCYPFRYMQGPGNEDEFFGLSLPVLIQYPQMEINEARTQLAWHRTTSVPKYQTNAGHISEDAIEALESNAPNTLVKLTGEGQINLLPSQPINETVFATEEKSIRDIQNIAGVDQYQMGNVPSKRVPTAEVNAIASIGGSRAQNDKQDFEQFLGHLAEDCLHGIQDKLNLPSTFPKYDESGDRTGFVEGFIGKQLQGKWEVEVFVNSTAAPNDAQTLESLGYLIQTLPGVKAMGSPTLLGDILDAMPMIRNKNKIVAETFPPAPPMPPPGMAPPPGLPPGGPGEPPPDMGGAPPMPGPGPQGPAPPQGAAPGPPGMDERLAALAAALSQR